MDLRGQRKSPIDDSRSTIIIGVHDGGVWRREERDVVRRPTSYTFHSVWRLAAAPAAVYQVLCHVESYPAWWPEVRSMRRLDERRFDTVCKSLLPYELRFVTEQALADPDRGVLEARLSGDLVGRSRWSIAADGAGTSLTYDQEVLTHRRLLNTLAPAARPAFVANHALMMRHGKAGLATFMAGYGLGCTLGSTTLAESER